MLNTNHIIRRTKTERYITFKYLLSEWLVSQYVSLLVLHFYQFYVIRMTNFICTLLQEMMRRKSLFLQKWKKFFFSKCQIRQHSEVTLPLHYSFQHQFLKLLHCLLLLLLLRWQEEQGAWLLSCCWTAWTTRRWRSHRSTIRRIWQHLALDPDRVEWPTPDVWNARSRPPTRVATAPPATKKNKMILLLLLLLLLTLLLLLLLLQKLHCCRGSNSSTSLCFK